MKLTVLIQKLLDKHLISHGTIIKGKVFANSLGQYARYIDKEIMVVTHTDDSFVCQDQLGVQYTMPFSNVREVDGMPLARFALTFNIKVDGSDQKIGKKRGRKPKKEKAA